VKFTERDLRLLEWTRKQSGGKVEILLVEIFNKGGKPDARKRK
jgi:hypothetical protein